MSLCVLFVFLGYIVGQQLNRDWDMEGEAFNAGYDKGYSEGYMKGRTESFYQ